jgi:hypothetical protein
LWNVDYLHIVLQGDGWPGPASGPPGAAADSPVSPVVSITRSTTIPVSCPCPFRLLRILLVVVLILVIGLCALLLDYEYEDEYNDDRQIGPSSEPGGLGSNGQSELAAPLAVPAILVFVLDLLYPIANIPLCL